MGMRKYYFSLYGFLAGMILLTGCSSGTIESGNQFDLVEFPDGSIAYLNQQSSVKFDKTFMSREVTMKGEVFFDVQPGDTPFIVHSSLGDVEVVGTEFNVNATSEELEVEVEEGIVSVKGKDEQVRVKKGQRAFIRVNHNKIQVGNASFKYRIWIKELEKSFKAAGKEFKRGAKAVKKESKGLTKDLNKELKKLKK